MAVKKKAKKPWKAVTDAKARQAATGAAKQKRRSKAASNMATKQAKESGSTKNKWQNPANTRRLRAGIKKNVHKFINRSGLKKKPLSPRLQSRLLNNAGIKADKAKTRVPASPKKPTTKKKSFKASRLGRLGGPLAVATVVSHITNPAKIKKAKATRSARQKIKTPSGKKPYTSKGKGTPIYKTRKQLKRKITK